MLFTKFYFFKLWLVFDKRSQLDLRSTNLLRWFIKQVHTILFLTAVWYFEPLPKSLVFLSMVCLKAKFTWTMAFQKKTFLSNRFTLRIIGHYLFTINKEQPLNRMLLHSFKRGSNFCFLWSMFLLLPWSECPAWGKRK